MSIESDLEDLENKVNRITRNSETLETRIETLYLKIKELEETIVWLSQKSSSPAE